MKNIKNIMEELQSLKEAKSIIGSMSICDMTIEELDVYLDNYKSLCRKKDLKELELDASKRFKIVTDFVRRVVDE